MKNTKPITLFAIAAIVLPLQARALDLLDMHGLYKQAKHVVASTARSTGHGLDETQARELAQLPAPAQGFAQCKSHFPQQKPIEIASVHPQWEASALCANNYAVVYSGLSKTPLIVVERLNASKLNDAQGQERTDAFFTDTRVKFAQRATLEDYRSTDANSKRYDRGHMAAAANMTDAVAMAQSFALTNIIPQDPHQNQKVWSKIESDVRKYARRAKGDVFVYTGPLFESDRRLTIGNGVWVPTSIFKFVFDASTGRSWGWVLPNTESAQVTAPINYDQFVSQTNWKLLPIQ